MREYILLIIAGAGWIPFVVFSTVMGAPKAAAWWRGRDLRRQQDRLMDRLFLALRDRPGDFVFGQYVAYDRQTGLSCWTANDDYGFKLWVETDRKSFGHSASGNVTVVKPGRRAARRILRQIDLVRTMQAIREADAALERCCAS